MKAGHKLRPAPGDGPAPGSGQAPGAGANGRTPTGPVSRRGSTDPTAVVPGPEPAREPGRDAPRPARAPRRFQSPAALESAMRSAAYIAGEGLSTAAFLALALGKPLLLEGAPGVGKTEAGKALAEVLDRDLIRLQCYEGMDSSAALYEWNYPAQMLALRRAGEREVDLYDEAFLIERPLLAALRAPARTLLLIDEIDRSDHEFEAFLLEFLSDFQISIPETGTLRAAEPPVVVLTSNRTRELHEALRRRCVYDWIAWPEREKEIEIVGLRARDVAERTARAWLPRSASCAGCRSRSRRGSRRRSTGRRRRRCSRRPGPGGPSPSAARSARRSRTRKTSPSSPGSSTGCWNVPRNEGEGFG